MNKDQKSIYYEVLKKKRKLENRESQEKQAKINESNCAESVQSTPVENVECTPESVVPFFCLDSEQRGAIETRLEAIEKKVDQLMDLLTENNVLLRRNLGLYAIQWQTKFPIRDEKGLVDMNEALNSEKRNDVIEAVKRLLVGSLTNLEEIISASIILNYNFDGTKGKGALNRFPFLINAIFEASMMSSHGQFVQAFRNQLKVIKNKHHKRMFRAKDKDNQIETDVVVKEEILAD